MPPPPNTTPAMAIDVGALPVDLTVDVSALGGGALWYRHTAAAGATVIGGAALAAPSSTYPTLSVFTDAGVTLYLNLIAINRIQVPVTPGATYYLSIDGVPGGSATVHLTLDPAPTLATPAGSLLVNDDTNGFPLAMLSASDGSVLRFRTPFPAGETGAALPGGVSLWEDAYDTPPNNTFGLYDAAFVRQATIVWPSLAPAPGVSPITTNRTDRFYVGDTGGGAFPARVTTITAAGAMGATVWTLPVAGLRGLAVSPDETILYHTGQAGSMAVGRWDLVHAAPLSPLAAVVPGYDLPQQTVVALADGTVLVGYVQNAPLDSLIRHYDAAGAVLQTYPFGAQRLDRLAAALDDPVSFWVWLHRTGSISRFARLRTADGVVVTTFDAPQYSGGIYQPLTQPPIAPFGHSDSCPVVVLPAAATPLPPTSLGRIRRVRRAPHLSAEQVEQFFSRFQLDLEAGVGNAVDPGADPQVFLRWSDDGGHTWRAPLAVSAGTVGAFRRRAIWRRLGRSRDRVFEVSMSDPVKWALLAASLLAAQGTS